jgi:hypothetical protein
MQLLPTLRAPLTIKGILLGWVIPFNQLAIYHHFFAKSELSVEKQEYHILFRRFLGIT